MLPSLDYASETSTSVDHTSQKSDDTKNITTTCIENTVLNSNSITLPLVIIGSIITITMCKEKLEKN